MKTSEILVLVNQVVSVILFTNMTAFYLMIFGKEGTIYRRPEWEQYFVRIGLLTVVTGSLMNILNDKTPLVGTVIVNTGLAFLFTWASIFHYYVFIKPSKK